MSLGRPSIDKPYHQVWSDILNGEVCLCVSNEIIEEYEEVLGGKTNPQIAEVVVNAILEAPESRKVKPTFFYHLLTVDPDDNKFVDCAICGNAELLVTNDSHFNILRTIDFQKVKVIRLQDYISQGK